MTVLAIGGSIGLGLMACVIIGIIICIKQAIKTERMFSETLEPIDQFTNARKFLAVNHKTPDIETNNNVVDLVRYYEMTNDRTANHRRTLTLGRRN